MDKPGDAFFPNPARLRAVMGELRLTSSMPFDKEIDLLTIDPVATSGMAAIVLQSRMLVRKGWSEDAEVAKSTLLRLEQNAPATPRSDDLERFMKREHRYRDPNARRVRCTVCILKEGLVHCGVCDGVGQVRGYAETNFGQDARPADARCEYCGGSGFAPCTSCEGTGETFVVQVHYATDTPIDDRRVVVPSLVGDLDDKVAKTIALIDPIPDAFRVDLQPTRVSSAYRGAMGGTEKPNLFGFDYLDAYDRARASVPKSPPKMILREDDAWGWPFLCVRWAVAGKTIDVGIVPDKTGQWQAVFRSPDSV